MESSEVRCGSTTLGYPLSDSLQEISPPPPGVEEIAVLAQLEHEPFGNLPSTKFFDPILLIGKLLLVSGGRMAIFGDLVGKVSRIWAVVFNVRLCSIWIYFVSVVFGDIFYCKMLVPIEKRLNHPNGFHAF